MFLNVWSQILASMSVKWTFLIGIKKVLGVKLHLYKTFLVILYFFPTLHHNNIRGCPKNVEKLNKSLCFSGTEIIPSFLPYDIWTEGLEWTQHPLFARGSCMVEKRHSNIALSGQHPCLTVLLCNAFSLLDEFIDVLQLTEFDLY